MITCSVKCLQSIASFAGPFWLQSWRDGNTSSYGRASSHLTRKQAGFKPNEKTREKNCTILKALKHDTRQWSRTAWQCTATFPASKNNQPLTCTREIFQVAPSVFCALQSRLHCFIQRGVHECKVAATLLAEPSCHIASVVLHQLNKCRTKRVI